MATMERCADGSRGPRRGLAVRLPDGCPRCRDESANPGITSSSVHRPADQARRSPPLRSAVGGSSAMRPLVPYRAAWLLWVVLAWTTPAVTWSATPPNPAEASPSASVPASDTTRDPESVLQHALELERQHNW